MTTDFPTPAPPVKKANTGTSLHLIQCTRGDPEIRGKRSPFLQRLINRAEN